MPKQNIRETIHSKDDIVDQSEGDLNKYKKKNDYINKMQEQMSQ